jgi:signal transduction histidine kinase
MMLKYWNCLFILALSFILSYRVTAQSPNKIDSLHRLLPLASEDTSKIKILFKLCWEHLQNRSSIDSAKYYADLGMEICRQINYRIGIARGEYYYGLMDRLHGNYYSGLKHFENFASYQIERGDSVNLANALYQMGVIYNYQGDYEKSLRTYLRILNIYDNEGDDFMKATTLNSIGIIFKDMGNYDLAIEKYREAYLIFDSLGSGIDIADCLHNLGNAYALKRDYQQALRYYQESLSYDEELQNDWGIAYQLESIGTVYQEMGQYNQALSYQIRSLEIREKLQQKKELASSLNRTGRIYAELGSYNKAISFFNRSLELSEAINIKPGIRDVYLNLADLHYRSRDFKKAFEYQQLYNQVKDSLFHEEMMNQISELQILYETEKKEQEILTLNQEKKIQQAQILHEKMVKNTVIIGTILLIIFAGVMLINYRQKVRTREIIAQKNVEINRRKISELEKNQKLYALDAMITGQDAERKRIARDLHDGLGALLSTVQMHFSSIENEIKKIQQLDIYNTANKLLDEACMEVRKISHNMMPGTLLKYGLVPAIEDLCNGIKSSDKLKVDFHAFDMGEERLADHIELTIYRLIQEGLNNIVKHARATEVIVQLQKENKELHLTIEDNGIGFNVNEARDQGGMGIRNLDSRVKYLTGRLNIESEIGKGTSITIDIPI